MIKLAAEPIVSKDNKTGKWYFRIKYYDDGEYMIFGKEDSGLKRPLVLQKQNLKQYCLMNRIRRTSI